MKAHSGWAALVVLGARDGAPVIAGRHRMELVDASAEAWARQPYHAAEHMPKSEAVALVARAIEMARRGAVREVRAAAERAAVEGHDVAAAAVLMTDPMPGWSVEEILVVHFRMHKAEGMMFREALARATEACGLALLSAPEKRLDAWAERELATPARRLRRTIASLGRGAGPPWGKDQKDAALAAMVGLMSRGHSGRRARSGKGA